MQKTRLGSLITNYKIISHASKQTPYSGVGGFSRACGRCGLCGNFGDLENMVWETNKVERSDGVRLNVKHRLDCRDSGVYAAQCLICREFYVGQTMNRFNTRWNGHRSVWREVIDEAGVEVFEDENIND